MHLLGIDYGKRKVGIALATSIIPEPIEVVRFKSESELFSKLLKIITDLEINKIIIGLSEGSLAKNQKTLAKKLTLKTGIDVEFVDETLTTLDAQLKSQEAGMKRSKRKNLEDAFAATLILEKYLENNQSP